MANLENPKTAEDWYYLSQQPALLSKLNLTAINVEDESNTISSYRGTVTFSNGVIVKWDFSDYDHSAFSSDGSFRNEFKFVNNPNP